MDPDLELIGQIGEFEDGPTAEISLNSKEVYFGELPVWKGKKAHLSYPPWLLPADGRFEPAYFHVSMTASESTRGLTSERSRTVSLDEFEAKATEVSSTGWYFDLYDCVSGESVASGFTDALDNGFVPDGITEEGDRCYLTIRLEYDHAFNKQQLGRSDEYIAQLREKYDEILEERR